MALLTQADLRRLFDLLNEELRSSGTEGELFLVGGAAMCLAYAVRPSTQDVDEWIRPVVKVLDAAIRVAIRAHVTHDWLNAAVNDFISLQREYAAFITLY